MTGDQDEHSQPHAARRAKPFRFLEPTQLAQDEVRIFRIVDDEKMRAEQRQEAFLLEGGAKYRVEIEPHQSDISKVELNELFPVLKTDEIGKAWVFTIDVASPHLFRKSEVLYYTLTSKVGKRFSGEIPLCIRPWRWRYWQTASYLGAAMTLQGVGLVWRKLSEANFSFLDLASEFNPAHSLNLLFLLTIPVAWAGLRIIDWTQYQISMR